MMKAVSGSGINDGPDIFPGKIILENKMEK